MTSPNMTANTGVLKPIIMEAIVPIDTDFHSGLFSFITCNKGAELLEAPSPAYSLQKRKEKFSSRSKSESGLYVCVSTLPIVLRGSNSTIIELFFQFAFNNSCTCIAASSTLHLFKYSFIHLFFYSFSAIPHRYMYSLTTYLLICIHSYHHYSIYSSLLLYTTTNSTTFAFAFYNSFFWKYCVSCQLIISPAITHLIYYSFISSALHLLCTHPSLLQLIPTFILCLCRTAPLVTFIIRSLDHSILTESGT